LSSGVFEMSDDIDQFPSRDEIERYKPFMETAKYVVSVISAFAAISAAILKNSVGVSECFKYLFCFCLCVNVATIVIGHRVSSEASALITTKQTQFLRDKNLDDLKSKSYSLFAIFYLFSLLIWTILIGVLIIS
jgi:hypothetical protein